MNRSIFFLFPVLFLLVTSCASLKLNPPSPDKQTVLILPVQLENTSQHGRHGYYYIYEIASADESITPYEAVFKLPIKGDMLIVDSLPPGNYFVDKFTFLPTGAANHTYGNNVQSRNDKFELESGKITIFSKSLNVKIWNKTVGRGMSRTYDFDIVPVSLNQKEEILATLTKLPNIETWKILDMEVSVQESGGLQIIQEANQILNKDLPIMLGNDTRIDSLSISQSSKEYNLTMTLLTISLSDIEAIISGFGKNHLATVLREPLGDIFCDSKEWSALFDEGYAINFIVHYQSSKIVSEIKLHATDC